MNWLLELYNGGLDPRTTDHRTLRETRSVSVASLVAALGSILVLALNALEGNWAEVPLIATLIPIGPLTLFLLHKVGKPSLTGQPLVAALVLIVTVTMGDSGLTGMGWIWLSAVPLLCSRPAKAAATPSSAGFGHGAPHSRPDWSTSSPVNALRLSSPLLSNTFISRGLK